MGSGRPRVLFSFSWSVCPALQKAATETSDFVSSIGMDNSRVDLHLRFVPPSAWIPVG
jgi:hypothetical protein